MLLADYLVKWVGNIEMKLSLIVVLSITFLLTSPLIVLPAESQTEKPEFNPIVHKIDHYAMPNNVSYTNRFTVGSSEKGNMSLGVTLFSSSPGVTYGDTYDDLQHINTTGRMILSGAYSSDCCPYLDDTITYIQFVWNDDDFRVTSFGTPSYSAVAAKDSHSYFGIGVHLVFNPEVAAFPNLESTEAGVGIVSGHYTFSVAPLGLDSVKPTLWYDYIPLDAGFEEKVKVPVPLYTFQNPFTGADGTIRWPHLAFQERPDGSHITHLAGATYAAGVGPHILYYFRKEGDSTTPIHMGNVDCPALGVTGWDCPWVYDTAWASVALVLASKKSGKVALLWTANRPNYAATPGCDTCSDNNDLGMVFNRFDNDLYYQTSDDYGVTWNNRVNVTKVSDSDRWRPYNDITAMFKGDPPNEKLCIAWVASDWDKYVNEGFIGYGARLYYWDENFPGLGADPSLIVDKRWDPNMCNAGAFNLNIAKPQISECNNGLYCLYVDLWDGHNRSRGNPDCSQRGWNGDPEGSVNGELMVSMSFHSGLAWDISHNLTNSPTSKCIDDCDSDHWPSMPRHGFVTMDSDTAIEGDIVLPRPVIYPNTVGASWLPVMYINDKDPGTVLFDNSTWQNNPVKFFYMGCVGPGNFLLCGDANNDGVGLDILDLTYIVDYIFRGGPSPPISEAADVNWDSNSANIIDLTAIVDFLFRGGSKPDCGQM